MSVLSNAQNNKYIASIEPATTFINFEQDRYQGTPQSANMAGLQAENLQSGAFAFRSSDVTPGKVASYNKFQRGTFYGAGMDNAATPVNPLGK